jgi:hypothetical protein
MIPICSIEKYKDIPNTYYITEGGKVINMLPKKIILMTNILKGNRGKEYYYIPLRKTNSDRIDIKINRLVALAFIPNPLDKPLVHHIDENKLNDDVFNLMWVTYKENSLLSSKSKYLYKNQISILDIRIEENKKAVQ